MTSALPPIQDPQELAAWFASGETQERRIGFEHEKLGMQAQATKPLAYDGEGGIAAMLGALVEQGWEAVEDTGHVIGAKRPLAAGGGEVSLEPGGQLEFAGRPYATIHEAAADYADHLQTIKRIAAKLGQRYFALGLMPFWQPPDAAVMPKSRYQIMSKFLRNKGKRVGDMMYLSASAQVSLDYANEADMVQKLRLGLSLQPLVTALYANSPFQNGKPAGALSTRALAWRDIDSTRTGMLPLAFEEGFGYERYADWIAGIAMCFLRREGKYIDVSGQDFRAFLRAQMPLLRGERPTMRDWADHLSVVFPEVRLKQFIEMRGADTCTLPMLNALGAFWAGLFYHEPSLDAACARVADWSAAERSQLHEDAATSGLQAKIRKTSLQDLAQEILTLAQEGLAARANKNEKGQDETLYLAPLLEIAASGRNPAQDLLAKYETEWKSSLLPLLEETEL